MLSRDDRLDHNDGAHVVTATADDQRRVLDMAIEYMPLLDCGNKLADKCAKFASTLRRCVQSLCKYTLFSILMPFTRFCLHEILEEYPRLRYQLGRDQQRTELRRSCHHHPP